MPALASLVRSTALAWTQRRPSILLLPLSRAHYGGNAVVIAAESFASSSCLRLCALLRLRAPPSLPQAPPSSPPIFIIGFATVVTPIPANLAATPSLHPFFPLSRVRVCLGLGVGPRHAIPAETSPSRGNTVAAPPCSPPTSTSHVSRLTGAVRVRHSYLESSALTH